MRRSIRGSEVGEIESNEPSHTDVQEEEKELHDDTPATVIEEHIEEASPVKEDVYDEKKEPAPLKHEMVGAEAISSYIASLSHHVQSDVLRVVDAIIELEQEPQPQKPALPLEVQSLGEVDIHPAHESQKEGPVHEEKSFEQLSVEQTESDEPETEEMPANESEHVKAFEYEVGEPASFRDQVVSEDLEEEEVYDEYEEIKEDTKAVLQAESQEETHRKKGVDIADIFASLKNARKRAQQKNHSYINRVEYEDR